MESNRSRGKPRKTSPWKKDMKRGSKLANDLSSPGSVNGPKHVVIVMDGLKAFTTFLLEWVLENVITSGHKVTLLGFMPWLNIPLSSKTWQDVWMLEFEHLSFIKEKNEWKNDPKFLKLQAVLDLCKKHGVLNLNSLAPVSSPFFLLRSAWPEMPVEYWSWCSCKTKGIYWYVSGSRREPFRCSMPQKEIVMGYPLQWLLVERIISLRATWVVFDSDRELRKNREFFTEKIPCNMVMMSEEGYMDMIRGRSLIDNGEQTPSESPASLAPTPQLIYSEPLKKILEEQDQELEDDDDNDDDDDDGDD